jgi:hypothetical protein
MSWHSVQAAACCMHDNWPVKWMEWPWLHHANQNHTSLASPAITAKERHLTLVLRNQCKQAFRVERPPSPTWGRSWGPFVYQDEVAAAASGRILREDTAAPEHCVRAGTVHHLNFL